MGPGPDSLVCEDTTPTRRVDPGVSDDDDDAPPAPVPPLLLLVPPIADAPCRTRTTPPPASEPQYAKAEAGEVAPRTKAQGVCTSRGLCLEEEPRRTTCSRRRPRPVSRAARPGGA